MLVFTSVNAHFFKNLNFNRDVLLNNTVENKKKTNFNNERKFTENLSKKYNDKDFTYTEEEYKSSKKQTTPPSPIWFFVAQVFANFMQYIFPFLLVGFIIFLVLKIVLGSEFNWFLFNKKVKKHEEKLVYEKETDIENENLEKMLQNAIYSENFRLAIRFYFLIILQELSEQQLIEYHKDKTNTEYLFELKDKNQKEKFSYLLYLYNYIWYGEFTINKTEFQLAEKEYQSFKKSLQ